MCCAASELCSLCWAQMAFQMRSTVLRALHCRMQRLKGKTDRQPEAQAPLMVPKAPEAHWLPPSTSEKPVESEATAQHSSAGSRMARRNAPVCSEDPVPDTAGDASSGDSLKQQPAGQSQPPRDARGDEQLSCGTQQAKAEETRPDAGVHLYCKINCRQLIIYLMCTTGLGSRLTVSIDSERGTYAGNSTGQDGKSGAPPATRTGHDVHALRGEALRQSDVIASLRSRMFSTEVRSPSIRRVRGA